MAKDSFSIRKSTVGLILCLPDEKLGQLIRAVFKYQINGTITLFADSNLSVAFEFIKEQIREDDSNIRYGEHHWNWKGGVTPENQTIRKCTRYKDWRKAVFSRDNYTCQMCGRRGGKLEAHHIIHFATNPELRFDIENGQTLCCVCHKKVHKKN